MIWFIAGIILGLFIFAIFRSAQPTEEKIIEKYKSSTEFKNYLEAIISVRLATESTKKSLEGTVDVIESVNKAAEKPEFDYTGVQFYNDSAGNVSREEIANFKENKIPSEWLRPLKEPTFTNRFTGKKVVITGVFSFDRIALAELLWKSGADLDTAINAKTNFVIKGDNAGWRKCEQIEELGIACISEDEVLEDFPEL